MTGIYDNKFLELLQNTIGNYRVKSKNIVCRCPWCEFDKPSGHFHLYISTETPIFHCFHAGCPKGSGTIPSLIKKLSGKDNSDDYVDKQKIEEFKKTRVELKYTVKEVKEIKIPKLNERLFAHKAMYVKSRIKHINVDLQSVKGLIFDIAEFVKTNNITLEQHIIRMWDYIQSNFVGFLTENKSVLICRNIDPNSKLRHCKLKIQETDYLDYYKINGPNFWSNNIVVAEGVFDIFNESIFDCTGIKKDSAFFASALSSNYESIVRSIAFYEDMYKINLHILSDRDVGLKNYKWLKYNNNHLLDSVTVYYNRTGKDFASTPCVPEKFIVD